MKDKKFTGDLVANVTVQVPVKLGKVDFNSIGDVIHNKDQKDAAEEFVRDCMYNELGTFTVVDRVDLDVEMTPDMQDRYDDHCNAQWELYLERADKLREWDEENNIEYARWSCGEGSNGEYMELITENKKWEKYDGFTGQVVVMYMNHSGDKVEIRSFMANGSVAYQELYRVANDLIAASGDMHHVFVERFREIENEDGKLVFEMGTGS